MDTVQRLANEWQRLYEERQQLLTEEGAIRRKLNSLCAEEEIQQLLTEKTNLKKLSLPHLRTEAEQYERGMQEVPRWRQAMTPKEFAERLQMRRNQLVQLTECKAPDSLLEQQRRLIWELEAPIAEVEAVYRAKAENVQQKICAVMDRIAVIEHSYRERQKQYESLIREIEDRRRAAHLEYLTWATQSREHLEWILQRDPLYKEDFLRRYQQRFPTDDVRALLQPPTKKVAGVHRRKQRKSPTVTTSACTTTDVSRGWRFFLTFRMEDAGQELHSSRDLASALEKAAYRNLDARMVFEKLTMVTLMPKHERQNMKQVTRAEPRDWKILRAGKAHRLFLLIDEEKHEIRFIPCPRRESYKDS